MDEPSPAAELPLSGAIAYRTPAWERFVGALKVIFAGAFCTVLVLIAIVIFVSPANSLGALVLIVVTLMFVPLGVLALANLSEPRRLVLREEGAWLGGVLAGRTVAYERIAMIKLDEIPGAINHVAKLTIEHDRRSVFILLAQHEAVECFQALRSLCHGAAAVGLEDEYHPPASEAHFEEGRRRLLREFGRRRSESLAGAVFFGAAALAAAVFLTLSTAAIAGMFISHLIGVALAALCGGAIWRYIKLRRTIREIRDGIPGEVSE